jgi:hypothetical protein
VEFLALYVQVRRVDGKPLPQDDIDSCTEYCGALQRVLDVTSLDGDPFEYTVEAFPEQSMILIELAAYPLEGLNLDQWETLREQVEQDDLPQAEMIRNRIEDHMGLGYQATVLVGEE